jgi:hypothetical protein
MSESTTKTQKISLGKKMPGILFLSFMMRIDPKPGQAHAEAVKEGEDSKLAQERICFFWGAEMGMAMG